MTSVKLSINGNYVPDSGEISITPEDIGAATSVQGIMAESSVQTDSDASLKSLSLTSDQSVNSPSSDNVITKSYADSAYMPIDGGNDDGPVSIEYTSTDEVSNLNLTPSSGSAGSTSSQRYMATFAATSSDYTPKIVAAIRASFTNNRWGSERLDFLVNGTGVANYTSNVTESLSSMTPVMWLTRTGSVGLKYTLKSTQAGTSPSYLDLVSRSYTDQIASLNGDGDGSTIQIGTSSLTSIQVASDGSVSLGQPAYRLNTIYASTGSINTSDAREKTAPESFRDSELSAACEMSKAVSTYKWIKSVESKGDSARTHIGLTVQDAISIMKSHDLDPFAYGFICYDKWADGDRYAFRYDELNLFIARGIQKRLDDIESSLSTLSAKP